MSKSLERVLEFIWALCCKSDPGAHQTIVHADAFLRKHAHMEPKNDGSTPNPWRRNMDYSGWEQSPYYGSVSDFMKKFPGGIREWLDWRKKGEKDRWLMWSDSVGERKKTAAQEDEPFHDIMEEELEGEEEYEPTPEELAESERELDPESITPEERGKAEDILNRMIERGLVSREEVEKYVVEKSKELQEKHNRPKMAHFVPEGKDDVPSLGENESPLYSDEGLQRFKSVREFLKQYKHKDQSADDAALKAVRDMVDYWKILLKGKKRRQKKGGGK